ncbi:MAG: protein kinase [Myxococcales bacterium]|jgi:serine/threonine-protein kinase|nr:protein kinase [Myxococcales bacterium]
MTDTSADYQVLIPLNPGTGSRALLALRRSGERRDPIVLLPIPKVVIDDPELLARLEKETARAQLLEHPGILRVYGLVQTSIGLCRCVEYAQGETLRTILSRARQLPVAIAVRLLRDVTAGVHYAHLAGNEDGSPLVHGDLRPETLMVSLDGVARVSGYGALSVAPREPSGAGGRRVVGRRLYSAPEQILGGRSSMAPTTDVFLLGLTLFETLTGEIPFQQTENPEDAVLEQPLQLERDDIPEKLRAVIAKATAKRSRDRYESALDLRLALEEAMEGTLASDEEVHAWLVPLLVNDPQRAELEAVIAQALQAPERVGAYAREPSIPPQPVAPQEPLPLAASAPAPAAPPSPQELAAPIPAAPAAPQPTTPAMDPPAPQPVMAERPPSMAEPLPDERRTSNALVVWIALTLVAIVVVFLIGQRMGSDAGKASVESRQASNEAPASVEDAVAVAEPAMGSAGQDHSQASWTTASPPSSTVEAPDSSATSEKAMSAASQRPRKQRVAKPGRQRPADSISTHEDDEHQDAGDEVEDAKAEVGARMEAPAPAEASPPPAATAAAPAEAPQPSAATAAASAKERAPDDLDAELEAALVSASAMEMQPFSFERKSRADRAKGENDSSSDATDAGPRLHLFTIPQVTARVKDGQTLGQTPIRMAMAAGRYTIELIDESQRIRTERVITVGEQGISKIDITLGIGGIYVTAPDGASIIIDGRRWGVAPIRHAIELYEGRHSLRVTTSKEDFGERVFEISKDTLHNFNFGSGVDSVSTPKR